MYIYYYSYVFDNNCVYLSLGLLYSKGLGTYQFITNRKLLDHYSRLVANRI